MSGRPRRGPPRPRGSARRRPGTASGSRPTRRRRPASRRRRSHSASRPASARTGRQRATRCRADGRLLRGPDRLGSIAQPRPGRLGRGRDRPGRRSAPAPSRRDPRPPAGPIAHSGPTSTMSSLVSRWARPRSAAATAPLRIAVLDGRLRAGRWRRYAPTSASISPTREPFRGRQPLPRVGDLPAHGEDSGPPPRRDRSSRGCSAAVPGWRARSASASSIARPGSARRSRPPGSAAPKRRTSPYRVAASQASRPPRRPRRRSGRRRSAGTRDWRGRASGCRRARAPRRCGAPLELRDPGVDLAQRDEVQTQVGAGSTLLGRRTRRRPRRRPPPRRPCAIRHTDRRPSASRRGRPGPVRGPRWAARSGTSRTASRCSACASSFRSAAHRL